MPVANVRSRWTAGRLEFLGDDGNVMFAMDNGSLLGFYAAAPVARPAAYTQTFAGADRTHAAISVGADIAAFTDPPSAAEMALLRTFVNALKADHDDLARLANQVIDDLQLEGLLQ